MIWRPLSQIAHGFPSATLLYIQASAFAICTSFVIRQLTDRSGYSQLVVSVYLDWEPRGGAAPRLSPSFVCANIVTDSFLPSTDLARYVVLTRCALASLKPDKADGSQDKASASK